MRRGALTRGATVVEFALIAPVLVTLMAGVSTYAWVFLQQATMVDAVAEGARRAANVTIDPKLVLDPSIQLRTASVAAVRDCLVRAGWTAAEVTVDAQVLNQGGLAVIEVDASVPLSTYWGGWMFSMPTSISYQLTVAAADQRALPAASP